MFHVEQFARIAGVMERKQSRIYIPFLFLHRREVDRPSQQSRRRSRLKSFELDPGFGKTCGQGPGTKIAETAPFIFV
jgi:hypothetical protein